MSTEEICAELRKAAMYLAEQAGEATGNFDAALPLLARSWAYIIVADWLEGKRLLV